MTGLLRSRLSNQFLVPPLRQDEPSARDKYPGDEAHEDDGAHDVGPVRRRSDLERCVDELHRGERDPEHTEQASGSAGGEHGACGGAHEGAAAEIRTRFPAVALLVLSQYVEAEYALRLLEGSERRVGYLLKDRILDVCQLTDAIARVVVGGAVVDPSLVAQLLDRRRRADRLDELTPREREALGLMAEGLTDRGFAQRLYVTPKTVETHVRHVFQKLSVPESALENKRVRAVLTYLRA
jgi:DNA-binding NarL/FixJ family response regulator